MALDVISYSYANSLDRKIRNLFVVSDTEPVTPRLGMEWFDTTTGTLYKRVLDSNQHEIWRAITLGSEASGDAGSLSGHTVDEFLLKAEAKTAVGTIQNPLLEVPLQSNLVITKGSGYISFTRNSTASYIDRFGKLVYANVDEPRFEKNGLLIEGESTNYVLHSDTLGDRTNTVSAGSVTIVNGIGPDGMSDVLEFTEDNTVGVEHSFAVTTTKVRSAGEVYSISCFFKAKDTGAQRYPYIFANLGDDGTGVKKAIAGYDIVNKAVAYNNENVITSSLVELANGWFRASITFQMQGDLNSGEELCRIMWEPLPDLSTFTYDGDGQSGGYSFGIQHEQLEFATSYIKTGDDIATRASEFCEITPDGNVTSNSESVTYVVDFSVLSAENTKNQVIFEKGIDLYNLARVSFDGSLKVYSDTGGLLVAPIIPFVPYRVCAVYDLSNGTNTAYLNGEKKADKSFTYNDPNAELKLSIGSSTNNINHLYGHIKNFRIYPKALSDVEAILA